MDRSRASSMSSTGSQPAKKFPKVLTASDKVVPATGVTPGEFSDIVRFGEKPVVGEDYSKLPQEQREYYAEQIRKAREAKRRDVSTPLFERGGRTHRRKHSKKTKRHSKKKVHRRRK